MNKREVKRFQKLLLGELDHLTEGIRQIEEDNLYETATENGSDLSSFAETGTDNFERETALNIASGESQWLNEVTDALKRIEQGTFGICESCDKSIPKKRLEVFPSARYCVECQSKLERNGEL